MSETTDFWADAEIIHSYSRAQALADGVLVAVEEATAREAGFTVPVALTRAAWEDCVAWDDADTDRTGMPQDEAGRLWDVLFMARLAARRGGGSDRVAVNLVRMPREGHGTRPRPVTLTMVIGPGDEAEPVITIGFPSDF